LEKARKFTKQLFDHLIGRNRSAVRAPVTRRHHVLNGSLFSVRQPDSYLLRPHWRRFVPGTFIFAARLPWYLWFRDDGLYRFAVPFGIVEVFVGFYEIVDRKIVLAIEQPRATSDDLLELDHRANRTH